MSGHKTPGTPPPVRPKPSLLVRLSEGTSAVLPPIIPPRDGGTESATSTARGGPVSSKAIRGTNRKKQNGRETDGSQPQVAARPVLMPTLSSPTAIDYNHALTQDGNALKLASTSDSDLLATGKSMSLKEFAKVKKARDLPCLVKVRDGQRSLCDFYSFGQEEMFVVLERKSTLVATCRGHVDGSAYVVPVHTEAFDLTIPIIASLTFAGNLGKMKAQELLQCQSLPPVMAVSREITLREHKAVPIGTLLFPKEVKKHVKDHQQGVLHAKTESGEMVHITADCKGCFSVLATDVRLSLQEAINHLKPPFTMRTISDCDTLYVNTVTVERVHKEDVLVGMMKATEGTTIDDIASFTRMAEIPVSLNLTVVTMVPKDPERKTLEEIYDVANAEYYGVIHHPRKLRSSLAKKVVMDSNPSHIDVSVNHAEVKHDEHPATSGRPAARQSPKPIARPLPRTPMQLSETELCTKDDHMYHVIAAAPKRGSSPSSKAAWTPFVTCKVEVPTSMCQEGAVNDSEANLAFLKALQAVDILQLLDSMNLSAYKDSFKQEHIDGDTMSCLTNEMLIELGVSKSLHRLRLMKVASGRISAKSFMCSSQTAAN